MSISRRALLRRIGAGAAAGTVLPVLGPGSFAATLSAAGRGTAGPVRLHRNENPAGASASAIAAIQEASARVVNRYPESEEAALRDALAEAHGVPSSNIVLGCGSGEILRMAAAAFAGPGKTVVVAVPTYDAMADAASAAGAEVVEVPLTGSHAHDLEAMRSKIGSETGLVYVCNPNNPTGTLTRRDDLERFLRTLPSTTRMVVDEAYHHYASPSSDYSSFIDRPTGDSRVIVTRTFSTIYGLAGLRVGYAVAAPDEASRLAKRRLSDGVSAVASLAAVRAVADAAHVRRSARQNADDRQEFVNQANARMLRSLDSQANFVMLDTERPGIAVVELFRTNGVLVSGPAYGYPKHIRVSIGTADEMAAFWRVWDLLPRLRTMSM
jgi:histidinol-phosphate aminotransferase